MSNDVPDESWPDRKDGPMGAFLLQPYVMQVAQAEHHSLPGLVPDTQDVIDSALPLKSGAHNARQSLQAANPTCRQQKAETNDPGPGRNWLGYLCQTKMGNKSDDKKNQ